MVNEGNVKKVDLFTRVAFFLSAFYLIAGNLPRFIRLSGFTDNILITEGLLYAYMIFLAIKKLQLVKIIWNNAFVYLIFILSMLYGILLHGVDVKGILYSVRMMLILFSGTFAGYLLCDYKPNLIHALRYLLRVYLTVFLFSLLIYLVFTDSAKFWVFLSQFGIVFNGDPHVHRMVSTYLDPNYFSAIACIPFLLSFFLYQRTQKKSYLIYAGLFLVAIVLSGSRSGLATLVWSIVIVYGKDIGHFIQFRLHKRTLYTLIAACVLVVTASPLFYGQLQTVLLRISIIFHGDSSALARLESFQYGWELFMNHPIFGLGYNFLPAYLEGITNKSSVDSSLLTTWITFGIIGSGLLLLVLSVGILNINLRIQRNLPDDYRQIFTYIVRYLVFVILFTSQFNNVLYYQFWLFPITMLLTYFSRRSIGGRHHVEHQH